MTPARTVVFVCLHGSAKSLIAAEYFGRLAAERGLDVRATSAGMEPDAEIPPAVMTGLLKDGLDVRGCRPRRLDPEELARASRVVSFGCDLSRIAPPGLAVERWDDVPAVSGDFAVARDAIVAHLRRLVGELTP
jgi:protein-tyrosine-phosphatase